MKEERYVKEITRLYFSEGDAITERELTLFQSALKAGKTISLATNENSIVVVLEQEIQKP